MQTQRVPEELTEEPLFLLVISVLIVASMLLKAGSKRYLRVPPVVGYIALGAMLRAAEDRVAFLPEHAVSTLDFMAELGVAALLFQVGLKSNLTGLLAQLPRALRVWASDVVVSTGVGFVGTLALGLEPLPSAFVAAALSATSVGISVVVWEEAGRLGYRLGQLLVDVAELDDLSAILLMLTVVAVAPILAQGGETADVLGAALGAGGVMLLKLALFAALCWAFARYVEERWTSWIHRAERPPDRILSIVGVAFGLAAVAGMLGFSVAVGALFAGLLFSRDPKAVREEASFAPIYALLTPFFFIDIGFALDTATLGSSLALGLLLFVPAALGKLLGVGLPVGLASRSRAGLFLGVSMIPRAEIALLVARTGNRLGPWAVPDAAYGALVCAAGLASIASPLVLQRLLDRGSDAEIANR